MAVRGNAPTQAYRKAAPESVETAAMPVGVEYGLQQAPTGETGQAGGKDPQKISAKRFLKHEFQCIAEPLWMRAEASGGKERKAAMIRKTIPRAA